MAGASGKLTIDEVAALLSCGPSLTIATRDADNRPNLTRCASARVEANGRVYVAVAMPEGALALENIANNGFVALTASRPTTYRTLQVKGRDAARVAWPEGALASDAHRAAFVREVREAGTARTLGAVLWSPSWTAIAFTPCELRDQTPGAALQAASKGAARRTP